MKTPTLFLAFLAALSVSATAAIIVPGADGSDGPLNITANTVIDLGLAPTGVWDGSNTGTNVGKGIYDPAKWAVVFKYSSVNVAAGATLTFKNNSSRAPVVWLVSGNVTIAGTVSLNGEDNVPAPLLAEPGPGGFRGGARYYVSSVRGGAGFGVGGGRYNESITFGYNGAGGGSYGSVGGIGQPSYGNPSILPLVGGSGGGGAINTYGGSLNTQGGGAGGGAILIACMENTVVSGVVRANGGSTGGAGAGSGGGIRLITNSLAGGGSFFAVGGTGDQTGGNGRIRIERVSNNATIAPIPDPSVVDLPVSSTALIWPPSGAPEVKVISVGGNEPSNLVPADPKAGFGTIGADVALPSASTTTVIVETTNVEAASVVKIRATPRSNANFSEVNATLESTVSTSPLVIRWTATLPVGTGYNAVQARVIRP